MIKRKKRKNRIIICFITIVVVFSLLYYFVNDNAKNNFLTSNLNDLSASILNITSGSFIKDSNNYNNDLKKEINNDYKKELDKLKETLQLNTLNSDKNIINATVIKRNMSYWYNNITIDKGKKDG